MPNDIKFLAALAHPQRLAICQLLLQEDNQTVNVIANFANVAQPIASQHIKTLAEAGIVRKNKVGTTVMCSINSLHLQRLNTILRNLPNA